MIRNFFITAIRNLQRNQAYTVLNIAGLALGIGCALTLFKIVSFELDFDTYHTNYDRIYRLVHDEILPDGVEKSVKTPHPLAEAIRSEFPEVEKVAMTQYMSDGEFTITGSNGKKDIFREDDGFVFAQNEIFQILDFEWIAGDPMTALLEPNSAVITKKLIKKYFNLESDEAHHAIGNTIRIMAKRDFVITGVINDPPLHTDFPFKVIASYKGQEGVNRYYREGTSWRQSSSQTNCWVIFKEGTDVENIERKLPALVEKYETDEDPNLFSYYLQPLSKLHYNTDYYSYTGSSVDYEILATLGIVGLFLVLTACINFINLATAQSVKRSKEIGLRKVMGGRRIQLVAQFLTETFIITAVSILIALAISEVLLVYLEDIILYRLRLDLLSDGTMLLYVISLLLGVTIVAGLYPSIFISSFNPVVAIKNKLTSRERTGGGLGLRRTLVAFQFGISQLLIIGTIIVAQQMNFFQSKDMGFKAGNTILLHLPEADSLKNERMKTRITTLPYVSGVSYSLGGPMSDNNSYSSFHYAPKGEALYSANFKVIDEDYLDYYKLNLLAGRNLRKGENENNALVNEKIIEMMGIDDPDDAVGKSLETNWNGKKTIVGVVENFHTRSLHEELDYVFMLYAPRGFLKCAVKIDNGSTKTALADLDQIWQEFYPENLYDYSIYETDIIEAYEVETAIFSLLKIFSIVAIFIGCLGLYGLVTFMANQRTKEIGIRKVLGATVTNILSIFSKELMTLLIIAFVIAAPLGFIAMDEWLTEFQYRIEIGMDVFIIAITITFAISLITMGFRSYQAATANPVNSLKDE